MPHDYILIAEPDVRLAQTFEHLVREARCDAVTVRDGQDARSTLAKRGLPSLLITNLVLPKIDGFALVEGLRRVAPATEVPVMAVSSSMKLRTEASRQKNALGITEIVASGMLPASLRSAVRRALAGSRSAPVRPRAEDVATLPPPALPPPRSRSPERLARIDALGLVDDAPPDRVLQQIVRETAETFGVPIALVSLVLERRQWFKAHVGLAGELLARRGTPIEQSFCKHVVDDDAATPLVVPDAAQHPLFARNPLVRDGTIGSYAGAPLRLSDGTVLGTLCILDTRPLTIGPAQVDGLVALARRVAGELELRALLQADDQVASAADWGGQGGALEAVLGALGVGVLISDMQRRVVLANRALASLVDAAPGALAGEPRAALVERLAARSDAPADILRRLQVHPEGPYAAHEELALARPTRRVLRWVEKPVRLPQGIVQLGTFTDVTAEVALRSAYEPPILFEDDDESL